MKNCRVCGIELIIKENWTLGRQRTYNNICSNCECERQKNPKYQLKQKEYRLKNKEKYSLLDKQYKDDNKEKIRIQRKEYRLINSKRISEKNKKSYQYLRSNVISHYSNNMMICMCPGCNENHLDFLTIDHIDNNGSEHRKQLGNVGGTGLYKWLIKNNFPTGFQVLCMNCNFSKGKHGKCSKHQ
jgi:hypothetical protein